MKYFNEKFVVGIFLFLSLLIANYLMLSQNLKIKSSGNTVSNKFREIVPSLIPSPTPALSIPRSYVIPQKLHVYQSFNNCGPATLSMALSYWGINVSQAELGNILRPYQVAGGDNDDKSVTLQEVAVQAKEYGLYAYLRPNGTPEKMEMFLSQGIPVVTRTWLMPNEDIGHYRVIRGYDKSTQTFIQDDSLQGENLSYSYTDFDSIWQPFNYEYLIIVPEEKKEIAELILGEELDEKLAWQNALTRIEDESSEEPDNWHLTFAESRIYYYLKDYKKSVEEFEKVENNLSFRTLWYQIEPIWAYFELGKYDRVMQITDEILNNQNRAFSELYHLRGEIYLKRENISAARSEFEKAVLYKYNYTPSIEALSKLSN